MAGTAVVVIFGENSASKQSCFVNGVDKCVGNEEALRLAAKEYPDRYECDDLLDSNGEKVIDVDGTVR